MKVFSPIIMEGQMKYFLASIGVLFSIILTPNLGAIDNHKSLSLLTVDVPPLISKLPDGTFVGVFYERLNCVLNKMQQPYSIEVQPWKRAQAEVRAGRADGFIPATREDLRDTYATFSDALMEVKSYFYYPVNAALKPKNPDYKASANVSALLGSTQFQDLLIDNYTPGPRAHSFDHLFDLLEHNRVDAVLAPEALGKSILKQRGIDKNYKQHFYSSRHSGVYITNDYLENHPDFLTRFNKEIPGCKLEHSSK